MQPLAGTFRKRRRHIVVGRKADPEVLRGKVGRGNARSEYEAAATPDFLETRIAGFIMSVPDEGLRSYQPPGGKQTFPRLSAICADTGTNDAITAYRQQQKNFLIVG